MSDKIRWLDGKCKIGNAEFTFNKMPGMRSWDYLGEWRPRGLADILDADLVGSDSSVDSKMFDLIMGLVRGVVKIDQDLLDDIRVAIFGYVDVFVPGLTKNPQPLAGIEDQVFTDLGVEAVFEVLVRGLAVNFTGFARLIERAGLIGT